MKYKIKIQRQTDRQTDVLYTLEYKFAQTQNTNCYDGTAMLLKWHTIKLVHWPHCCWRQLSCYHTKLERCNSINICNCQFANFTSVSKFFCISHNHAETALNIRKPDAWWDVLTVLWFKHTLINVFFLPFYIRLILAPDLLWLIKRTK